MMIRTFVFATMLVCLAGTQSFAEEIRIKARDIAEGKQVVDLYARPDARQRVLLLTPKQATAAVVLFAGGHGKIRIKKNGKIKRSGQKYSG